MAFKFNLNNTVGNIMRGRSIQTSLLRGLASSGLSGVLRKLSVGLFGTMTRAEVHISNLDTGERVSLALTPDKISVKSAARFQSYNVIENGEVKIPRGENLSSVSWNGVFVGEAKTEYNFVNSSYWEEPATMVQVLETWRQNGNKLRLLVTQTSINMDCYISSFSYDWEGGLGDANYSIEMIAAKDMMVKTVEEVDAERAAAEAEAASEGAMKLNPRPGSCLPSVVTSTSSSSLWSIAQGKLGDGGQWQNILNANSGKVKDPMNLAPGIDLKLPH